MGLQRKTSFLNRSSIINFIFPIEQHIDELLGVGSPDIVEVKTEEGTSQTFLFSANGGIFWKHLTLTGLCQVSLNVPFLSEGLEALIIAFPCESPLGFGNNLDVSGSNPSGLQELKVPIKDLGSFKGKSL